MCVPFLIPNVKCSLTLLEILTENNVNCIVGVKREAC